MSSPPFANCGLTCSARGTMHYSATIHCARTLVDTSRPHQPHGCCSIMLLSAGAAARLRTRTFHARQEVLTGAVCGPQPTSAPSICSFETASGKYSSQLNDRTWAAALPICATTVMQGNITDQPPPHGCCPCVRPSKSADRAPDMVPQSRAMDS